MKKVIVGLIVLLLLTTAVFFLVVEKMPYFKAEKYLAGDAVCADAPLLTGLSFRQNGKKMVLRKTEGSWLANGYYAANTRVEEYLDDLRTAVIINKEPPLPEQEVVLNLKFASGRSGEIRVAPAEKENLGIVTMEGKSYLVNKNLLPPADFAEYYRQPLLPLKDRKIEQIIGFSGEREILTGLRYEGALPALPEEAAVAEHRNFVIITADGIKILCGLYKYREQFFMTVGLKTTIMPTAEAEDFVNKNGFRYDGWFFVLTGRDGNRLFEDRAPD